MKTICSIENRKALMGIAVCVVTVCHLTQFLAQYKGISSPITDQFLLMGAGYGVDIFFFLSMVGLGFSYERNSLLVFYKRRAKRIYPVYCLFLFLVIIAFLRGTDDSIGSQAVYHLTGLSVFKFTPKWIEWYVPALILLYVSYPLFFRAVQWAYGDKLKEFLFLLGSIAIGYGGILMVDPLFSTRFPVVYLGILSYFYIRDSKDADLVSILAVAASIGCLLEMRLISGALILPAVLFVLDRALLSQTSSRWMRLVGEWVGHYLGNNSYEIYLAQIIGTKYLIQVLPTENWLVIIFLSILCTIALTLVFIIFNRLVQNIGRNAD